MKKLLLIVLGTFILAGFSLEAAADSFINSFWRDQYEALTGGVCEKLNQESLNCTLCHVSDTDDTLNPYGADIQFTKNDQGILWPAAIVAVEGNDSDDDGLTNIEEIDGCAHPGDPDDFTPVEGYTWNSVKSLFE